MEEGTLTYFKNGQRLLATPDTGTDEAPTEDETADKGEPKETFDVAFGEGMRRRVQRYNWYLAVSVWHGDVRCHVTYD